MKFCNRLLGEINFEPGAISPCCNVRAIKVPEFAYKGGKIDLEKYAGFIEDSLKELQGETSLCKGCPELVDIEEVSGNCSQFSAISLNMHRFFCNCKCCYCNLWDHRDKGYGYDPLPAIEGLHESRALKKNALFSWGGGEPTILPWFDKTASWILRHGYYQNFHTNALRCSPLIEETIKAGKGLINVSLDSASPRIYHDVKGLDGFARVTETISSYAKANAGAISLKYIIFEKNNDKREIRNFLTLARDLGIGAVMFSLNFEETKAGNVSPKTLAGAAYFKFLAKKMGLANKSEFYVDPVWQKKIDEIYAQMEQA